MADYARVEMQQTTTVQSEDSGVIAFRPDNPGLISVVAVPDKTKTQTEENFLAQLDLFKPGSAKAVASYKAPMGSAHLGVSYTATAADMAVAGNWTCRLTNGTLVPLTFSTTIAYISTYPLQTASFDIALLQTLLTQIVSDAQLRLHLQSSASKDDVRSRISWSPSVATMLGASAHDFHLDDINYDTNEISSLLPDLDILPNPLVFEYAFETGVLAAPTFDRAQVAFVMTLPFGPTVIQCADPTTLEIDVASLQVTVTVGLDGRLSATCQAKAEANYHGVGVKDLSGAIQDAVASAAGGGIPPAVLFQYFERFFVSLMRLNDTPPPSRFGLGSQQPFHGQAHVASYSVSGDALVVSFYTVPQPVVVVAHQ